MIQTQTRIHILSTAQAIVIRQVKQCHREEGSLASRKRTMAESRSGIFLIRMCQCEPLAVSCEPLGTCVPVLVLKGLTAYRPDDSGARLPRVHQVSCALMGPRAPLKRYWSCQKFVQPEPTLAPNTTPLFARPHPHNLLKLLFTLGATSNLRGDPTSNSNV